MSQIIHRIASWCTTTALLSFAFSSPMNAEVIKEHVSAETIKNMCKDLSDRIKQDNFKPDLLIGLTRGGLIPLGYLAGDSNLNLQSVYTIGLKSYEGMNSGELSLTTPVDMEHLKKFKNILIVDDLVETGKTLVFVTDLLKATLPEATIKTAVLYRKPLRSNVMPDYYLAETNNWIVFPWE